MTALTILVATHQLNVIFTLLVYIFCVRHANFTGTDAASIECDESSRCIGHCRKFCDNHSAYV